jgi:hypothetical protein
MKFDTNKAITWRTQLHVVNMAALPSSPNTIGAVVALGKIGEVTGKKWVLLNEYLGDGWRSLAGGHVNLTHSGRLLGHVVDVELTEDGEIQASLALSRRALEEYGIDSEDFKEHYSVSVEWLFSPLDSYAKVGDKVMPLINALEEGSVILVEGPVGNPEIIPAPMLGDSVLIYPANIKFTDLAVLNRKLVPPNFRSARFIENTNSAPLEVLITNIYDSVNQWADGHGYKGLVQDINTNPKEHDVYKGEVYALINDKKLTFAYNANTGGGVTLEMSKIVKGFCQACNLIVDLANCQQSVVDQLEVYHGKCAQGHDITSFNSEVVTPEVVRDIVNTAVMSSTLGKMLKIESSETGTNQDTTGITQADVDKAKEDAATAAVEAFKTDELPKLVDAAVTEYKTTLEADNAKSTWVNASLEALEKITPLTDEEKTQFKTQLEGLNEDRREDAVARLTAERTAAVAIKERDELKAKFGRGMNVGPAFDFSSDEDTDKTGESFTI